MDEEENWLRGERTECAVCHQALYRVDHSPFYDEYFLYCTQCPIHAEVSLYDPVYQQVSQSLVTGHNAMALMRAVEARLNPCACGGTFRHDAPRRCLTCHAPVIVDDPAGVDLFFWHEAMMPDGPDLRDDELDEFEARMAPFARTTDLWRNN